MNAVKNIKKANKNFRLLPLISIFSKCHLGELNTKRFAERINSAANLIVSKEKFLLHSSTVDKLVTFRVSKSFMLFVQNNKNRGNINFISGLNQMVKTNKEVWC